MSGTLIICGTPIGNLADSSGRLKDALASAEIVYAEDTRRTSILLRHLGVKTRSRSYFVANEASRAAELEGRLVAGETVALVTDAGMPALADPGYSAIQAARSAGAQVTVVPGPSALTAAVSVSGLPSHRLAYEGFLPRSGAKRRRRLAELGDERRTMVIFTTKERVESDIADLTEALEPQRRIAVTRELTKVHEEIWWGTLGEAEARWSGGGHRGEFTLVIEGRPGETDRLEESVEQVQRRMVEGESVSQAVRNVAEELGVSRRELYELAIEEGL